MTYAVSYAQTKTQKTPWGRLNRASLARRETERGVAAKVALDCQPSRLGKEKQKGKINAVLIYDELFVTNNRTSNSLTKRLGRAFQEDNKSE